MHNVHPLSNLQLELLKLYSNNISEQQLMDIRTMLSRYFAEQATQAMEQQWEQQNLNEQTMRDWTNEHNRSKSGH